MIDDSKKEVSVSGPDHNPRSIWSPFSYDAASPSNSIPSPKKDANLPPQQSLLFGPISCSKKMNGKAWSSIASHDAYTRVETPQADAQASPIFTVVPSLLSPSTSTPQHKLSPAGLATLQLLTPRVNDDPLHYSLEYHNLNSLDIQCFPESSPQPVCASANPFASVYEQAPRTDEVLLQSGHATHVIPLRTTKKKQTDRQPELVKISKVSLPSNNPQ